MSDHLTPTTSDRGFDHLPIVPGVFAGQPHGFASVYESSNADVCEPPESLRPQSCWWVRS